MKGANISFAAVSFRCSIEVGETSYSEDELLELIDRMGVEYSGQRYHLLQTNCNNFSSDLCYALCGKRPPGWTNRLAGVAVALHCLCPSSIVPPLQPPSMCPYGETGVPAYILRIGLVSESGLCVSVLLVCKVGGHVTGITPYLLHIAVTLLIDCFLTL